MSARRASSAGPTPFSRSSGISRRSASVSGGSPVGTRRSTPRRRDTGYSGWPPSWNSTSRCGNVDLDVLADALGVLGRGVAADEHGDDLAVVVDERAEQLAHRVGRRARRRDHAVARRARSSRPRGPRSPSTDGVAHGLRDLAGAHALERLAASTAALSSTRRRSGRTRRARRAPRARSCVGDDRDLLLAERVDLLGDRRRCSCCSAARSRSRPRHASTASRICAVDGFIDWPPATTCCTPRLVSRRRIPVADADRDDRGGDDGLVGELVEVGDARRPRAPSAPLRPARSGR